MIDKSALEELANISNVKLSTIERRQRSKPIPGIRIINNRYDVMEGTRYPYSMRGKRASESAKKRFYLLEAIYLRRFIDSVSLGVEPREFDQYLAELLQNDLIMKMNWENQYGANGYITTPKGDRVFAEEKKGQFIMYSQIVGTALGSATKQFLDT